MPEALVRSIGRRHAPALVLALAAAWAAISAEDPARAQTIDCGQLRAQIAQADRGGRASSARRPMAELGRAQAQAQQLGCGSGGLASFFGGGDPRCAGLEQRIQQLQAYVAQVQQGGGGSRGDLVARFNAYCRGGQPPQQAAQPRGFFESLFGGPQQEPRPQAPLPDMRPSDDGQGQGQDDGEAHAHGGGQAVCVRTCDGGFFPLGVSSHHDADDLKQMCGALCPGTETQVFTRNPNSEINTAASLDGKPYMDMPNALKFSKTFVPDCSCKPANKSWAQALANAEEVIGNTRKGDIVVTQAKSDELSRPKMDARARASMLAGPAPANVAPDDAAKIAGDAADNDAASPPETAATDGTAHTVRRVGPQP